MKQISTLTGILIIVVFAIIIFGGVMAWQYYIVSNQKVKEISEQFISAKAKWKTYTSYNFEFEIKYPVGTKCLSVINNGNGNFNFGRIEIVGMSTEGLGLSNFVDKYLADNAEKFNTIDTKEKIKINGEDAISVEYHFGGANRYGRIVFLEKNTVMTLGYAAGDFQCDEPQIFQEMLSTFKFIN